LLKDLAVTLKTW